jgi:histone H3/H4
MPNVELLIVKFLSDGEISRHSLQRKLVNYQGILTGEMDRALNTLTFERIVKQTSNGYRLSDNYEVKLRSYVQNYSR